MSKANAAKAAYRGSSVAPMRTDYGTLPRPPVTKGRSSVAIKDAEAAREKVAAAAAKQMAEACIEAARSKLNMFMPESRRAALNVYRAVLQAARKEAKAYGFHKEPWLRDE